MSTEGKNENHRFFWNIFLKMGTSPKSCFFSFDLYTYIGLKGLNRFKIYRYDFSQLLIFCFSVCFPFCFPVVSPPGVTGPASLTDEPAGSKSSSQPLLARGLRPNDGVVQRGNTTGTTLGKHNGGNKTGNKTGNNREKLKNQKIYPQFLFIKLL